MNVDERLDLLGSALGYRFNNQDLLWIALTHKSYANEKNGAVHRVTTDNERLEFLGDAVLDLALSDCLMDRFPMDPEGSLSKKRASLVNEDTLFNIATELKLEQMIRLGKGELKTGGLQKPRILASALEALLGAIFVESGYPTALEVARRLYKLRLEEMSQSSVAFQQDFKTRLQERMQERHRATPIYHVESETGPDHEKRFEISVKLDETILATGAGRSKKAAEQDAARQALENLDERTED